MGIANAIVNGVSNFLAPWTGSSGPTTVFVEPPKYEFNEYVDPQPNFNRPQNIREAVGYLQEAAPTLPGLSFFSDKYGFRSLTQNVRDLNDSVRLSLLNRAETLSLMNGMAHRALEIRTNLIVSEGFKVEADPDKDCPAEIKQRIDDVLSEHWDINEWTDRTYERVFDLGRTGELIRRIPALNRNIAGNSNFKLGRFTAGNIAPQLVYGISLDPWNYERLDRLYLEQYAFPNSNFNDLSLKILRDERLSSREFGSIRGDVLYLGVNRRPGCSRGITDLAPAIDWLDIYEQMLLMDCDRAAMMMRFIWDVSIENASPQYIKAYAESLKVGGPKPGTVRVHSNKEVWDAVSPDLKLSDSKELREDIFVYAWGAMGLPRPWFSDGENSNRATLENQTDPQFAWARTRRRQFTSHLELEHRFALQVAYESGRFSDIPIDKLSEWLRVKVVSRDPDRRNYDSVGATWNDMANALTLMVTQEFVDKQTAVDVIRTMLGSYGFEVDAEKMQVVNAYDGPEAGKPISSSPQAPDSGFSVDGSSTPNATVAQSLPGGTIGLQRESASRYPNISRRSAKGIFGSNNSIQSLMGEAHRALEKSKRENRKLLKYY